MDFLLANKASLLLAVGAAALTFMLMRLWRGGLATQKSQVNVVAPRATSKTAAAARPLLESPPEMVDWEIEMHETARQLKAELDTKIAVLQRLVIDARQEAERLEEVIERADQRNDA